jgi:hypothetical protein
MSQEIAIRDDGFAVSERGSNTLLKGITAKFATGIYKANKTEILEQAPHGPAYVVLGVVTCWVHWQNKRPIEHRITQAGQIHPWREDLGNDDKTEWELDQGGTPRDPWKDTRYVYLLNPQNAKTYTFITDTVGGRQAVGELKDAIMTYRQARPGAVPVVQLATGAMPTRHGGEIPRPDFVIIDWRGGPSAPAEPQQQIEEFAEYDTDDGAFFGEREPSGAQHG